MKRNIILIGFMGAGKTSFGKWLAKEKCMEFVDTDEMIVKSQGVSIPEIFEKQGEECFRDMETALIRKFVEEGRNNLVLSVGGGLPVRKQNRELLKELGLVIYLRATVDTLCERLRGDTGRPLLQGGDVRNRILTLMEKRAALYEDGAERIIDTDGRTFEEILEKMEEDRK